MAKLNCSPFIMWSGISCAGSWKKTLDSQSMTLFRLQNQISFCEVILFCARSKYTKKQTA